MKHDHFEAFLHALAAASSRRGLWRVLTGVGLAAFVGWPLTQHRVEAKKKQGKKGKKHKKKKSQPPAPVATADAACHPMEYSLGGERRFAQTFRALRSGQLTSASFGLAFSLEGAAFDLAIREVDPEGKPGYVLARTAITNVPPTDSNGPPRTVSGAFATPPTVVAGQGYALTVTEVSTIFYPPPFSIQAGPGDPCSDGMVFMDKWADGAFRPEALWDLAFSTEVTA